MNKIKIIGYFKNSETNDTINYNTIGYLMNDTIKFEHDNTTIKIKRIENKLLFEKEDKNSILKNYFLLNEKTNSEYYLKKEKLKVNIPVFTNKLIKTNKLIEIEYKIDKNKNKLHLEIEVI